MKIIKLFGGLGNQMFQYAFYNYLLSKGYKNVYLDKNTKGINDHDDFRLMIPFIKVNNGMFVSKHISRLLFIVCILIRKLFKINLIASDSDSDSNNIRNLNTNKVFYIGYWQNKFFIENVSADLRIKFTFKPITDNINKYILNIIKENESVSIHVRRGDYFTDEKVRIIHGDICTVKYYNNAIQRIKSIIENPTFFVFSDDISWAKANLKLEHAYFIDWNIKNNSYIDMQLMSNCKHNIIANSSFSWWAAWINDNPQKTIVAPDIWTNETFSVLSESILPSEWFKIKIK